MVCKVIFVSSPTTVLKFCCVVIGVVTILNEILFQYFPDFIDQQLKIWDEKNRPGDTNRKKILELSSPSIQQIDGKFYWIAGAEEVHLLNHERTVGSGASYARKLGTEEIAELPIELVYVGPDTIGFINDEEKAFTNLVGILERMNLMQDPKFVSFPLGNAVFHQYE